MADYKGATPTSRSSLIPVGGRNFYNMQSVAELDALERDPEAAWHRRVVDGIKAQGKVMDSDVLERVTSVRVSRPVRKFGIGATVRDTEKQRKGTIIAASVGYTAKKKTPVHRIADKNGKSWLARETNLELVY